MKKTILKISLIVVAILILMIPIFIFLKAEKVEKQYQELVQKIESASEKWVKSKGGEFEQVKVKLEELKNYGLLTYHLVNPKTNRPLANETYVTITKDENGKYVFSLQMYDIPKEEVSAGLIIRFYGDKKIQNGISVRYQELGISVHEGEELLSYSVQYFTKGEEVVSIDSSRPRNYEVVYTALNSKGELAKVVRKVIVQ